MICFAGENVPWRPDPGGEIDAPRVDFRSESAGISDMSDAADFPRQVHQSLNCDMQARHRGAKALKCA
jgi:hypothetical protein